MKVILSAPRRVFQVTIAIFLLFLLVACQQNEPTATPEEVAATTSPTDIAESTATFTPAPSNTPPPSATPPASATPASVESETEATMTPTQTPSPVPSGPPSIVVQVLDADGQFPIPQATIAIFIADLNLSVVEETNEEGFAFFLNMSTGTFPIAVSAPTYEEDSREVQVVPGENQLLIDLNRLPPPEVFAVSTGGRTNVRNGPGGEYDVVVKLDFNQRVEVNGRDPAGEWLLIRTADGIEGWVAGEVMDVDTDVQAVYITTPVPTPTYTPLPPVNGTINNRANLRARPRSDGDLVMQLEVGAPVQVLFQTEDNNWLQVRTESGTEGWLFFELVDLDAPQDLVPIYVPTPIPSPTIDPSVTPPTATPPPPPTSTPIPTPIPGIVPTAAPFNPFVWRAQAIYLDNHVVELGGVLDRLFQNGYDPDDCNTFLFYAELVEAAPTYLEQPPLWRGPYFLYDLARLSVIENLDGARDACINGGNITELNYFLLRDAINQSHDWLTSAIRQANELFGIPGS